MVIDVNGLRIEKGDVVAPINGDFKGRVCATKTEEGEGFVCIRAAHRPYSKGVWYASDHVQRLMIAPKRREEAPKLIVNPTRTKPIADGESDGGSDGGSDRGHGGKRTPVKVSTKKRTTRPKASPAGSSRTKKTAGNRRPARKR